MYMPALYSSGVKSVGFYLKSLQVVHIYACFGCALGQTIVNSAYAGARIGSVLSEVWVFCFGVVYACLRSPRPGGLETSTAVRSSAISADRVFMASTSSGIMPT